MRPRACFFGLLVVTLAAPAESPGAAAGEDVLWIWHAADAPAGAKRLAVLLDHIELRADRIKVRQRRRALYVAPDTTVTPVVHVQVDAARPAVLGARESAAIVAAMQAAAGRSTSGWVQLDFEASRSAREDYLRLVSRLRRELPRGMRLSVTTQAHWCSEPELMARIEADEVVPMFFHTGDHLPGWWGRLRAGPPRLSLRLSPRCLGGAAGFAPQQAPPDDVKSLFRRRYWFSLVSWNDLRQEQ